MAERMNLRTMEMGQICFGNPVGEYEAPLFVEAFLDYVLWRIELVFWNRNQKQWQRYEDPEIPGMEFRPYYWGDDESEALKPNLKYGEVEIRWYKHPGRSMSVNVDWDANRWAIWLDDLVEVLSAE